MNKYAEHSKVSETLAALHEFRSCTRKKRFATKAEARQQKGMNAYKCKFCKGYHRAGTLLNKTLAKVRRHTKKPMTKPLIIGVGVILIQPDLRGLWMNERQHCKDYNGMWQCPGGRVDDGETTISGAAARELEEETGIKVNPLQLVKVFDQVLTKEHSGEEYRSVQFALITDKVPEDKEPDKHGPWMRVAWDATNRLPTFGALNKILADLRTDLPIPMPRCMIAELHLMVNNRDVIGFLPVVVEHAVLPTRAETTEPKSILVVPVSTPEDVEAGILRMDVTIPGSMVTPEVREQIEELSKE